MIISQNHFLVTFETISQSCLLFKSITPNVLKIETSPILNLKWILIKYLLHNTFTLAHPSILGYDKKLAWQWVSNGSSMFIIILTSCALRVGIRWLCATKDRNQILYYYSWLLLIIVLLLITKYGIKKSLWQRRRTAMLYKKGILKTFCKIHRKTPAAESLFNEVARLQLD